MDLYEKIKELAAQKHTSIRKIEEQLGYGNGTIRRWNKNKPNYDKIQAVAKYFNVSVDYLLGNEELKKTNKPIDLKKVISEKKPTSWDDPRIDWNEWVSFDGEPISDDVKKILFAIYGDKLTD
ncbi:MULTISPECIES: XRE family transcriptional regulator [Lactococcus]|uniref:XRE family transcriptional regulator n=1 Tax=Lactococcus TaxID=1357 RepID=UPI001011656A|nr:MULTISPECIES: XRE family transcriptional regulator [Lactococcus]MCT4407362.1 XRE family transcriptional regulator [Lactococcus cremoris]MCT4415043.1 XRE family transcriptional regulator [Lactococcus cremoris]MCX7530732.1 helix-turn-helix domain-containing protein [Lactococcus lactis]MDM7474021.1 helix-turn-helix domain-containing protein [Lactococcus lactis]MDN6080071.1 helix-turn-helix domain-containing protein [Lactococcus lactis]